MREFHGRGVDGLIYLAFDNDAEWPEVAPLLAELPHVVSVTERSGHCRRFVRAERRGRRHRARRSSTSTGRDGGRSCRSWRASNRA